ncbi:hypothetical protein DL766_003108 [Monosporascus sp. MC13-8B]|uniref:Uncharacterized protein n=1 Tax=Monosporascus cannonballus TaxID=155416 RepID=A0ABY0HA02_9PEZI|nr:hypothetical protein DL763_006687 [Monosporascus cannonballus]RYO88614.1 hypothetical protein DL762_003650 [Monosporascus cannonballus]RYP34207.1 hypothetical protein DL766_003108 [Monosporascus sp. MC13-8B]
MNHGVWSDPPTIEVTDAATSSCVTCLRDLFEHRIECPEHELLALFWPPNHPDFENNGIHTLGMERDFLRLAIEYLYLSADEQQLPLYPHHRTLYLPKPTAHATASLYPESWNPWPSFTSAWATRTIPTSYRWGFRFPRSQTSVALTQHLPPVPSAFPSAAETPAPSPSALDRAACRAEWRALHDLLRAELAARARSSKNLRAVADMFDRVRALSLSPEDPMWSVVADVRNAAAREDAAAEVAARNMGAVVRVLDVGCWGSNFAEDNDEGSGGRNCKAEGNSCGNGTGGLGGRGRREGALAREEIDDEVYVWSSRPDIVERCHHELQWCRAYGHEAPVTPLMIPSGQTVLSVRWRLSG